MLGGSLPTTVKFSEHQRLRTIYNAALTPTAISSYLPVIQTIMKGYFDKIYSNDGPVAIAPLLSSMIVDIVTTLMYGPQLTAEELGSFSTSGGIIQAAVFTLPAGEPSSLYQQGIAAANSVRALATPLLSKQNFLQLFQLAPNLSPLLLAPPCSD
jgi:cytochrome P450